ncbi:MAG: hypothetical protein H6644_11515 [Caldilineaceae bacterium]|nr:hypothetical protein [Caldilineaceae bacterium]
MRLSDNLAKQERVVRVRLNCLFAAARFTELQAFKALASATLMSRRHRPLLANQDYLEMLRLFRVRPKHSLQTRSFWGYTYELSACALAMAKLGRATDGYTVTAPLIAFRRAGAPLAHRQGLHDEVSRTAKTQLDAEVMAAAWQRGMHMTLSEITALTLADT